MKNALPETVMGKSEVGPGDGEIQRPTPVLLPTLNVPDRLTAALEAPFNTVVGLSSVIDGAATLMFSVAGGAMLVAAVNTPVPMFATSAALRLTVMNVADAEVGVRGCADPPGGVNVSELSGVKFVPVSVTVTAVFWARFEGLDAVSVGAAPVMMKFEVFDVAVPTVTKIWAVPAAVSRVFGTLTVMLVVEEAAPVNAVMGDPLGGIQVAVVPPPTAKPVPVITTFWVRLFCTAVFGDRELIVGAVIGSVAAVEDAVPEITRMLALPEFATKAVGIATTRDALGPLEGVRLVGDPPGGVNSTTGDPPTRKLVPAIVSEGFTDPFAILLGVKDVMAGCAMVMEPELEMPPAAVVTKKVPVPTLVKSVFGTLTVMKVGEGVG